MSETFFVERSPSGQHFVEDATECPDVRSSIDGLPRACSGLADAAVPSNTPMPVIIAGDVIVGDAEASTPAVVVWSRTFANPKSST